MRHIIAVLLENEAGALSRVVGLFAQRNYNIESLTVAPTEDSTLSRLTLTTIGDDEKIEQIIKHLYKVVEVVKVVDLSEAEHVERELLLIKVRAEGEARAEIKRTVDIPVIATNRINDPFIAEKIIASGRADLAGMGRALLADPELPDKARHGRIKEIIPCLACSKCLSEIFSTTYKKSGRQFTGVSCVVNPMAGREDQDLMKPAKKSKRVFIVGGGPAGLTAAWTAAKRGHSVTLFEKDSQPGGWLNVGCRPPHKEEILTLSQNLAHRARMAGADIRTDSPADPKTIKLNRPDVLILALGASPFVPDIPGVELPHVVDAVDVLAGNRRVDGDVVIVGGGLVGCETAEFLLGRKQNITSVTIVEMLDRMAENLPMTYRPFFLARLKKLGARLETQSRVEAITTKGVNVTKINIPEFFPADAVVLALGLKTDPRIEKRFAGLAAEIYSIGDCVKPRMIKEAIAEGFGAGEKI